METYIYAFGSVALVSLISFVGIFTLALREDLLRKYVFVLVSLSVGALVGDVFLHLLPETFRAAENTLLPALLVIAGIFIFFIFEKSLHWHHHDQAYESVRPVGKMILLSDGVHNFVDGLIVGASFLVSVEVGLATTLAVILHEIPQEIGDFGVLLYAGYTKSRAIWYNFLSALFAVVGVAAVFLVGRFSENLASYLIPLAAGGFTYVALSDLVPELHRETRSLSGYLIQIIAIALGVAAMVLLLLWPAI